MDAKQVLEREFLEIRSKILEVAASLDRIERAEGDVSGERTAALIAEGITILADKSSESSKAERVQMLFSREYDQEWQDRYDIESRV